MYKGRCLLSLGEGDKHMLLDCWEAWIWREKF